MATHPGRTWILRAAQRLSESLLWLYPRSFRQRYGSEMARAYSEMAREHYEQAGLRGLIWLEIRAVSDTVSAAFREHRAESARGPLGEDLRHAVRYLLRQPIFSLAIVATLALGIGAATAIFSVIYAALMRPLPYTDGDRLITLSHQLGETPIPIFSLQELEALKRHSRTLEAVEEYHSMSFILLGADAPERVMTGVVSTGYFDLLGVEAHLGRTFESGDVHRPVLVLGHDYWLEHLGGDPAVVGRRVEMNDHGHTVIGVLPPLPAFPERFDVFMPTMSCPFRRQYVENGHDYIRTTRLLARLAPGATLQEASLEAGHIFDVVEAENERPPPGRDRRVVATRVSEELAHQARPTFVVLLATAAFVLLIVLANAANLTLARLARRDRELALRTALGAGRGRLLRQLTAESLVLAGLGGVLAVAVCTRMLDTLSTFAARFTVRADEIRLDAPVLSMALVLVLASGTALALLPFLPPCRRLAESLKDGGRFPGHGRHRLQRLLVVAQLAVSFVLLAGAGLMLRTVVKLHEVDPGFHTDNVLTLSLDLNWSRYDSHEKYASFFNQLLEGLAEQPEIESAAVAETFPLHHFEPHSGQLRIEGRTEDPEPPRVDLRVVSDDYFKTLGIEVLEGQGLDCVAEAGEPSVVVVNRSLAHRYFPDQSPIGQRISIDDGEAWTKIVGVVDDVKLHGLDSEVRDEVYVSLRQHACRVMTLLVRTRADPHRVSRAMWQSVYEIDRQQAIAHLRSLEQIRHESLAPPRLTSLMLGGFAFLALALTAFGVCGVLSLSVSQRTHEIGVRMALGARRQSVLWMVMGDGMGLALLGLGLGLAAALALSRSMTGLLYGVEPTDPWTLAAAALLLLGVAAGACFVPARWASGVQPTQALRQD